ncbi:hypothetical protein GCM10009866_26340 [Cellulomonas aerilata]
MARVAATPAGPSPLLRTGDDGIGPGRSGALRYPRPARDAGAAVPGAAGVAGRPRDERARGSCVSHRARVGRGRRGLVRAASAPGTAGTPDAGSGPARRQPRLLIAHPSPDVYGSDRQLLETVDGARRAGWTVQVVLPSPGPLVELLRERGATVRVVDFPVLRKALLRPGPLVGLAARGAVSVATVARGLRRLGPDVVYVNTVTIPFWLLAARLAGVPALAHVHEAEEDQPMLVRRALAAPFLLADEVVVNSAAARRVLLDAVPALAGRTTVVHNGVPGPPADAPPPRPRRAGDPARLALVGRLSPRKGIDVALEAVALLVAQGRDVSLTVCGTPFPGYEWYEQELTERAARPDLAGRVHLAGYVHPTWDVLADADVVLVPSRVEPFGNTAAEALLARRPVVASGVQGLAEVVVDGRTGLLVPAGDAPALASAVAALLDEPGTARRLADEGLADARRRFSTERYGRDVVAALERCGGPSTTRGTSA